MKVFFKTLSICLLVLFSSLTLVGCGNKDKEHHSHNYVEGLCWCGKTENTFVKETDWNNLFVGSYLNNVIMKQNMYLYNQSDVNTIVKSETTRYSMCSENAIYIRTSTESVYHVKQNGSWFAVEMVGQEWYGINETETEAKAGSFQVAQGVDFTNKYSLFDYSEEGKYFIANNINIGGETCEYVKIYSQDNKLIKIERKVNVDSQFVLNIIDFSNHGTIIVYVPQFTIAG